MLKFLQIFQALQPLIIASVQSAEAAIGPGKGVDKFNFALGMTIAGINTIPDFKAAVSQHDAASIQTAASSAVNLIVAGLNAAGKLGKPATQPALTTGASTPGK